MTPFILALMLSATDPDAFRPRDEFRQGRAGDRSMGVATAMFEFAPTGGAGMGAVCACAIPTGSKGEVMTYTRAGNTYCQKGFDFFNNIANGDLVACTTDQPKVQPCNYTSTLGLFVEPAATNNVLRSTAAGNAAWTKTNITVTSNNETAPNGGVEADEVLFNAVGLGTASSLSQGTVCTASATNVLSWYVKGKSGTSGTIDIQLGSAGANFCAACAFNGTTWTRCYVSGAITTSPTIAIGNIQTGACTNAVKASADVAVWGAQCETGSIPTSAVDTTGSFVTRSADTSTAGPSINMGTANVINTAVGYSMAASIVPAQVTTANIAGLNQISGRTEMLFSSSTVETCNLITSGDDPTATGTGTAITAGTAVRTACAYIPKTMYAFYGAGGNGTAAAPIDFSTSSLFIGATTASGGVQNGCIRRVCVDRNPLRCR